MYGVVQPACGIPFPSLRFHAMGPHAVEGYPTAHVCLALQLYCSSPEHISLLPPVLFGTTCGYTGSLTRESPLIVSMNLMQGFCVESQDQVSGLYGSVTEVMQNVCFCVYPLIALTLCPMTLVHLCSILHFPSRSAITPVVHSLSVYLFFGILQCCQFDICRVPVRSTLKVLSVGYV